MGLTARDIIARNKKYLDRAKSISKAYVAVGLPKEKTSGKIYGDGNTVIDVGAHHEYGTATIPRRSFLRLPHAVKRKELNDITKSVYRKVVSGSMPPRIALGLIGSTAVNISKNAFRSKGYGQWQDISSKTKKAKKSNMPLLDTGTLRNSITYVVRGL